MATHWSPFPGGHWILKLLPIAGIIFLFQLLSQDSDSMNSKTRTGFIAALVTGFVQNGQTADVDLSWYAPNATAINNLTQVIGGSGVYGFIYNSSVTSGERYGEYNWCNMPHVRATEYKKAAPEYSLQYVEVIHRHHKRTVYAANSFPVESYGWDCGDEGLFYYGQPENGKKSAHAYWEGFLSPQNPFVPSGFLGSCQFPQITAEGLEDSWQHGKDLYGVYHDLLGFLPDNTSDKVAFRVTQNVITSEVAGMVINGMFGTESDYPLAIQPAGVDSLEPQYTCTVGSSLSSAIRSGSNWTAHLTAASSLYTTLDDISGVSPTDSGFHASFDHYYDNLSARQCHNKPLPCKLINGLNSTTCITQTIADSVFRLGNYEYSHVYRDDPRSLAASVTSYGVWVGELMAHIRGAMNGTGGVIYRHNVAHDGSLARLLSMLQVDVMVWPGMGSEVVFELYKMESTTAARRGYFVRVLWKGQVLRSSNPSLGLIDMLPVETLLGYFDGLVGVNNSLVKGKCSGAIPV